MPERIELADQEAARRTRRAFLAFGTGAISAGLGWKWLWSRPQADGLPDTLRGVLNFNGGLVSRTLVGPQHLAPEFAAARIGNLRPNGDEGLDDGMSSENWHVGVTPFPEGSAVRVSLKEIQALPAIEQTTEFKCIEGWSTVTKWKGARFSAFLDRFAPGAHRAPFVSLMTPDQHYFVGVDMASMLHPQTILAYERNGKPLEREHGAPLRLVIPVKYGIKNIKRIGTIAFSRQRPEDYWAREGYDYYAGL